MKRLIGEFEEQNYTQIIFPHEKTDWKDYLQEAESTFVNIINAIRRFQTCLVVCYDVQEVKKHFADQNNIVFVEYESNDTWARDCSALASKKVRNHNSWISLSTLGEASLNRIKITF